ncbi:MAG TPA: alpha/beta fold hydrolase, partial [Anaerolineae bacterium]|nr:alpha/beta fold hydrolase [Anaerolineae bacterium]
MSYFDRVVSGTLFRPASRLWRDARVGMVAAVAFPALAGLLVALTMPRGPLTSGQAIAAIVLGLVTGVLSGLSLRSPWAALLAPVAYGVVFEIGRAGTAGPLVDAPRLDSTYAILAIILGRGVHALLVALPMVLGVFYGIVLARRLSLPVSIGTPAGAGYLVMGVLTLAVIALAILIALPARTPPVVAPDGEPVPGSIATLEKVRLGGHDQWISIRGYSTDNPVLLYLSGGPGQSDLPYSRVLFDDLARDFVVVGWDQRGTGKSHSALDPRSTLTLDQAVSDTAQLSAYLRDRFGESKIYLLGESYGSFIGVLAVQRHPELYYAFIGSGQMVDPLETTRRLHNEMLAYAAETGDEELAAQMHAFGEPPYNNFYANAFVMGYYDALAGPYTPPRVYVEKGTAAALGPWGILATEYTFMEKLGVLRGLMDLFSTMWPHMLGVDLRRDVTALDVPIYILDAGHELAARRDLALEWYNMVD